VLKNKLVGNLNKGRSIERRNKMKIDEIRNEPYFKIDKFIKDSGYTYTVKDVLDEYKKHMDGFYVSCTMGICIRHLEDEIKQLLEVLNENKC
jgi:hypothetical protein